MKINDPATTPQEFTVGEWAYNNHAGHNARVLAVEWDKHLHGFAGGWRYMFAGYSSPYIYREDPTQPYFQYEQVGPHCHKPVGPCSRDDQNITLEAQS